LAWLLSTRKALKLLTTTPDSVNRMQLSGFKEYDEAAEKKKRRLINKKKLKKLSSV
jgi:hypothetical protein